MGRRGQRQFRQALEQRLKGNQHFKPRQWRADAEMDSGTEAHMGVWFARRIKLIGICKTRRVTVGRAQHQAHLFALLEFDPGIFNVFQRVAGEQMQRCIEAQNFFDESFR